MIIIKHIRNEKEVVPSYIGINPGTKLQGTPFCGKFIEWLY